MSTLTGPIRLPLNGGKPDSIIIMLHGLSSSGDKMISLADDLSPLLPGSVFYAPNAPYPYDAINDPKNERAPDFNEPGHYQWYSRFSEKTRQKGLLEIQTTIDQYIKYCVEENQLSFDKCAIVGFSQGCITALNVLPRLEYQLGALIAHSGYLFSPDSLVQRKNQRARFFEELRSSTPTCGIHGIEDAAQPWQVMHEAILTYDEAKIPSEFHLIGDLGHAIGERSVEIMGSFLKRNLKV